MAWTSGFFNSVNNDRLYSADQISKLFEGLITNGVYESVGNQLAVQPNNGMTVQIATGRGWFDGRWANNDSEYRLTLEPSDVVLNRYAAVVIKVDHGDSVRSVTPYLKYGEFATTPTKPSMTRTETIKEFCLAYIYIGAGVTSITGAVIEDTRSNSDLCGWVTGLITQINATTLFSQYESIFNEFMSRETANFNEWFNSLQVVLNGDVATMLTAALPMYNYVELQIGDWVRNGNVYNQTINIVSMTDTKTVIVQPNPDTLEEFNKRNVECSRQALSELTFTATSLPTGRISVSIMHMGV